MSIAPSFQFYPRDWRTSEKVNNMTPTEKGIYIDLICLCWENEGCSIPDDDSWIAKQTKCSLRVWRSARKNVASCFTSIDGKLVQERLLMERKKQHERRQSCSFAGTKSAEKRVKAHFSENFGSTNVATNRSTNVQQRPEPLVEFSFQPKSNFSSSSSSSIKEDRNADTEKVGVVTLKRARESGPSESKNPKNPTSRTPENAAPNSVASAILQSAGINPHEDSRAKKSGFVFRAMGVTRDPPEYAAYWGLVWDRMCETPHGIQVLFDAIKAAEDATNPLTRQTKGVGLVHSPGRFVASKCYEHLLKHGKTLPAAPRKATADGG